MSRLVNCTLPQAQVFLLIFALPLCVIFVAHLTWGKRAVKKKASNKYEIIFTRWCIFFFARVKLISDFKIETVFIFYSNDILKFDMQRVTIKDKENCSTQQKFKIYSPPVC